MFRRNFRRSGFRRPKAPTKWHREFNNVTLADATNNETVILDVSDYNANAALSPGGVTVLRVIIEGTITAFSTDASPDPWRLTAGLFVLDRDQAVFSVESSQNLIDERVLRLGTWSGMQVPAADTSGMQFQRIEWDITQRVRLKDQELRFCSRLSQTGGTSFTLSLVSSVLLRGDTN